ncbi:MAG: ATP-binding cassette domain-containing protein [Cytophagales bacterium]|nr:ATP-binding cassette domain-containing protein [Cytophagales bacterium]
MNISQDHVVKVQQASIFQENSAVLSDISFEVKKGEFIYLVGRTGSGKSSLLKTFYADLELRLGDIEVVGYNIRKIKSQEVPFLRRQIGIIFQDFELFYDRSVADNLAFVMRATGWKDQAKMKTRMAEVLMRVGLGAISNKMPHQLSGGEQQRVVIARALVNEPKILMADEPTGNLDPEVAEGIIKLFQEINRSGMAVIMATHYHQFIDKFPQRVLKCEGTKILDSSVEKFELKTLF